ncbi:MAG: FAD-binding oxidoreductase [Myxococcota bacterium]
MDLRPIDDPDVLAGYLTDASNVPGHAEGLFRPRTTEEVADIVRHCQQAGTPLTVTAARTSTTAAAVPQGGLLLSMEGLTELGPITETHATAQAGLRLGEFQTAIEQTGRFYPPDPTSRHDCTLGASIACNASGARSFRYGATRKWVEALTVVLPTGLVRRFTRGDPVPVDWPIPKWPVPPIKTSAGYEPPRDAVDLFVGQEGTLGIITEATVRLTDLPTDVVGLVAFFEDRESVVRFVEHARAHARANAKGPLSPRALEYLDQHCLDFVRQADVEVPPNARAALFCEQEITLDDTVHLEAWLEALAEHDALVDDTLLATDEPSRVRLHRLRHAIPAGINERIVRNGMPKVGTDLAVPDDGLSAMMEAYEASPIEHVLFGHIGDNHLHLNLLPKTNEELTTARAFYDDLAKQALSLGGTVSAEHGIGKLKRRQLAWMVGPHVMAQFRALKQHLDPAEVLGRGNVLVSPNEQV